MTKERKELKEVSTTYYVCDKCKEEITDKVIDTTIEIAPYDFTTGERLPRDKHIFDFCSKCIYDLIEELKK